MSNTFTAKMPKWFWVVSILALIWNLLGIMGFVANVNLSPEALAEYPVAEQEIYNNTPLWATMAFAIGVLAGTIGSLGLVLRKRWAKPILIVSLIAVLLQLFHGFILANGIKVYGPSRMIMPIVIVLVGVFLIWFANMAENRKMI